MREGEVVELPIMPLPDNTKSGNLTHKSKLHQFSHHFDNCAWERRKKREAREERRSEMEREMSEERRVGKHVWEVVDEK